MLEQIASGKIKALTSAEVLQEILSSRQILQRYPLISARDAAHIAVMLNRGIKIICSYDKHFDSVKEIERIEPR